MGVIIDRKDLKQVEYRKKISQSILECLEEVASSCTAEAIRIEVRPEKSGAFYRTGEIAAAFQVSERMVRKWCESGRVPALKTPGGAWRIPKSQFADLEKVKAFRETVEHIDSRFAGYPDTDEYEK